MMYNKRTKLGRPDREALFGENIQVNKMKVLLT